MMLGGCTWERIRIRKQGRRYWVTTSHGMLLIVNSDFI